MATRTPGFRVLLPIHIPPGLEAQFEREWESFAAMVCDHPANHGHWLMRSSAEEGVYYIGSDWVDEAQFRQFEQSPEHQEQRASLNPYRTRASVTLLHVVRHRIGRAG